MKLVKPPKKCKCGDLARIHCISVMINGCDTYWCYLCWKDHSDIHQKEWNELSDDAKDKLMNQEI